MTRALATCSAVVFAYHDVGVRCLRVLLDAGVRVSLVVTHQDDPQENVWFASVADVAAQHGLPCVATDDPNTPGFVALARARAGTVDFLFSFYFRRMLGAPWLNLPSKGAFNMHGSLLPRYRGRAPVNWAIIHGERETGASLHAMAAKPDSGALVGQCAVPILGDDTAREVFGKVVVAAEIVLATSLPRLIDGSAVLMPQDLAKGSYFGGRRPEDGRIPNHSSARQIHDLVRALAPPYPCAFIVLRGQRVLIERTQRAASPARAGAAGLQLASQAGELWLLAADGDALRVLGARCEGDAQPLDAAAFERRFGGPCLSADA